MNGESSRPCTDAAGSPVAQSATQVRAFAIATTGRARHKDRAFQASSPKNFQGRFGGPFFLPAVAVATTTTSLPHAPFSPQIGPPYETGSFQ